MNSPASAAAEDALDDPRVIAALDEYVAAFETGRRPDRVAFLAAHAEIAGPLAKCLDGLSFLQSAAPELAAPELAPPVDAVDLDKSVPLGDYHLVRVLGRGGMGVVYEAEQLSLGRRVALKVLPFASALDPKQLQRFKNEAQAAAHLQHPSIVPVYGVGCERGVHYYAMQFIEGRSLAQAIRELRDQAGLENEPTPDSAGRVEPAALTKAAGSTVRSLPRSGHFRQAARWAFQAAQGLEHAHQVGVIHRDIKPANLLVDTNDHLWITDFGLAQFHNQAGLTMTGDLLGTLRYMSPEQASAQREIIDHRTDIYSLGATLYELLTLQPTVTGNDRAALVQQITNAEPTAPRRLQPGLPLDLETITLKALAKAPAERYATAQDFADDLRRFLDDRPVLARRPTLVQRLAKAVRRHRAIVTALACAFMLMLVLAVVILGISARRIADREAKIHANYLEAKKQQQRAEENFKRTLAVVDRFLLRVGDSKLGDFPQTAPIRRDLLLDALLFFEEFLAQKGDDPALRFEIASAHRRIGQIQSHLSQSAHAKHAYRRGLEICERLVDETPDKIEYREELARLCYWLSFYISAPDELENLLERGIAQLDERDAAKDVNHAYLLALLCHNLGYHWASEDRAGDAEQQYRRALRVGRLRLKALPTSRDAHDEQAYYLTSYGILLRQRERLQEAADVLQQARELQERATRLDPSRDDRNDVNRTLTQLSTVLWRAHRRAEALKLAQQVTANYQALVKEFPSEHRRGELALTLHAQASWLTILEQPRQAETALRQALEQIELALALGEQSGPRPVGHRSIGNLAMIRAALGQLLHEQGRGKEAEACYRLAFDAYRQGIEQFTDDPELAGRCAWLLLTCPLSRFRDPPRALVLAQRAVQLAPRRSHGWAALGLARYRTEDYQAAAVALDKAALLRVAGEGSGGFVLAMAHWRLGNHDAARKQLARTASWMDEHYPDSPELLHFRAEAEQLLGKS